MLQGVYHQPYAYDDLYSTQPTERMPRDPMEGDTVLINATSWPIESGQTVWITWTKNGVAQPVIGASWQYNDGNNSYWQASLGRFTRGDRIEYLVHANEDSANEQVIGPFSFLVISWSTVTGVTGYTDNGSSVDVHVGDSAGSFSPVIRFAFPTDDGFHLQLAPSGAGLTIAGPSHYTVTDSPDTLMIATAALVLKIQKSPYRLAVYQGDGTTLIVRQYDPAVFRNFGWASDGQSIISRIEDHYLTPNGERFYGFGERYDYLDQRGAMSTSTSTTSTETRRRPTGPICRCRCSSTRPATGSTSPVPPTRSLTSVPTTPIWSGLPSMCSADSARRWSITSSRGCPEPSWIGIPASPAGPSSRRNGPSGCGCRQTSGTPRPWSRPRWTTPTSTRSRPRRSSWSSGATRRPSISGRGRSTRPNQATRRSATATSPSYPTAPGRTRAHGC